MDINKICSKIVIKLHYYIIIMRNVLCIIYSMFEKPTNAIYVTTQVVMDYYKGVMEKSGESGQMDPDTFR